MTRTFYKYNNYLIRLAGGELTDDLDCCCSESNECCCLEQYIHSPNPADEFTCVITGAVGGTGTLVNVDSEEGYCLVWQGTISLSTTCGGEFQEAVVKIKCPTGSTDVQAIEIEVLWGGADCEIIELGGSPVTPDAGADCHPLDLTFTNRWETNDIIPAGCPCGDGTDVSIHITFP